MRPGFDAFLISTSIPTPYLRKSRHYLHNIYLHRDRSIHWQEWPKGPLCPALAGESEGRNQPQSPLRSHSILPNPRVTAAIVDIYNVFSYCASLYWVITCQDFNEDIVNRFFLYKWIVLHLEAEKMIVATIPLWHWDTFFLRPARNQFRYCVSGLMLQCSGWI